MFIPGNLAAFRISSETMGVVHGFAFCHGKAIHIVFGCSIRTVPGRLAASRQAKKEIPPSICPAERVKVTGSHQLRTGVSDRPGRARSREAEAWQRTVTTVLAAISRHLPCEGSPLPSRTSLYPSVLAAGGSAGVPASDPNRPRAASPRPGGRSEPRRGSRAGVRPANGSSGCGGSSEVGLAGLG